MSKRIIIDASYPNETRVALIDNSCSIAEIEYETASKHLIKGNIYLATITNIEPSLQAAFIDYGNGKSGFLPFSEIHPNYYHNSINHLPFSTIPLIEITSDDIKEQELYNNLSSGKEINIEESDIDDSKIITALKNTENIQNDEIDPLSKHNEQNSVESSMPEKQQEIQDVISKGQMVLVQATKESRGNKNASFTTYISLSGKYCILNSNLPNNSGISRRITNSEDRKQLKSIVGDIISKITNTSSVVIRTAGAGRTSYEIKKDFNYLLKLWNEIINTAIQVNSPAFIHIENDIIRRTILDMYNISVTEIIIQGKEAYDCAVKFMNAILPSDVDKIKEHKSIIPIFTQYKLEEQLATLYKPIVNLPSGGYIVINPTEALIAIDVNSGKDTSEQNIEETAIKTNLEAAKEISRQIKLRNLSGLITIDFICMLDSKNHKLIEKSFKQYLINDKARIQIDSINHLGVLQMSRQRLRPSFLESNSVICSHCNGKGIVRAEESNAMIILRTIENEIYASKSNIVNIYAHLHSITYILNNKRAEIAAIEKKYNVQLKFYNDFQSTSDSFSIEKVTLSSNTTKDSILETPLVTSSKLLDNIENPILKTVANNIIPDSKILLTKRKQRKATLDRELQIPSVKKISKVINKKRNNHSKTETTKLVKGRKNIDAKNT
ncbi:ribonuclease, Rne/Rng family domain protein [Orientia chuto str. Dubai]|uniref:Ribonuclease G n=1 Tax=Orientia chuto str. Dubai TaxID=1359168 RepID=A0A0F3MKY4_9RICK|nr:Rne/Rng family ribonuclease [Candidatus Orientia mediorientalis]KJV56448.1 ribonuclease, Rne/Rng family domain protein [Orientia chuto str. Dubai]